MTLPASGLITMAQIRTEVGGGTGDIDMGADIPRLLANKPTGAISMSDFYGKTCTVYEVTTATYTALGGGIGFVEAPSLISGGNFGSISPTDLFRGWRIEAVVKTNAGSFSIHMPNDPNGGQPGLRIAPGNFRSVYINGYVFYEADALVGGGGGGRTTYSWETAMMFTSGQTYTLRFFY